MTFQTRNDDLELLLKAHPCYSENAQDKFARMHLAVAPKCNIQCNYCNRKFDCTNESRPGVTSNILTPREAVEKVRLVYGEIPYLSVIGIAGPGDPLYNEETFETLGLLHQRFPRMSLCLSTNGLLLAENVERLKELGVRFITVTFNAIDVDIGKKIYDFVNYKGQLLREEEAVSLLIDNQIEGIKRAVEMGMLVKVNSVMVPGVNDKHLPMVAKRAKECGAYIINIIPFIPVIGTKFEDVRAPTARERSELQSLCQVDIRQMRHCRHCRADAIGLLGEDRSARFANFACGGGTAQEETLRKGRAEEHNMMKIAVATTNSKEVDQHFGQAEVFDIYIVEGENIKRENSIDVTEQQEIPLFGPGHRTKLERTVEMLNGMDAVIALKYGEPALDELRDHGILPLAIMGNIEDALHKAKATLIGRPGDGTLKSP